MTIKCVGCYDLLAIGGGVVIVVTLIGFYFGFVVGRVVGWHEAATKVRSYWSESGKGVSNADSSPS